MKIKITCDNGANIHSRREADIETEEMGFSNADWSALSDEQKDKEVWDWVMEMGWVEICFEEVEK